VRYGGGGSRVFRISRDTSPGGGGTVCVKRHSLVLVAGLFLAASSGGAAQQSSERDAVTPRIGRLEQWFSAIASHRPGAVDEQVRLVNTWNQEQLHQIWIAVSTIVSLVREPDVSPFYVNEPSTRSGPGQQGQLSSRDQPLDTGAVHGGRIAADSCARQEGKSDGTARARERHREARRAAACRHCTPDPRRQPRGCSR
jgi:hypothetical protein